MPASKMAQIDPAEELAIRFLLSEDGALEKHVPQDKSARTAYSEKLRRLRERRGLTAAAHELTETVSMRQAGRVSLGARKGEAYVNGMIDPQAFAKALSDVLPGVTYRDLFEFHWRGYEWDAESLLREALKRAPQKFKPGSHDFYDVSAVKVANKLAKSNAKVVEVPATFSPVVVEPPKATRKEFPFQGFIDFQGLKIDVENVKGSTRSGKGPEGEWSTYMFAHYGEIRGTEGTDGDKLDVYVGDNHDSSLVVVIHQHNPWDGQYDEDKVVLGCESIEEAIGLYKKQYDRPGFFKDGEYTAMPIGAFWRWVQDERNQGKKVKVAKKAAAQWKKVPDLTVSLIAQSSRVQWVRIRSTGQMGLAVAARLPTGWDVQYVTEVKDYNPRNLRGRPIPDDKLLKLYKDQGGYSPAVLIDPDAAGKGVSVPSPARVPPPPPAAKKAPVAPKFTVDDVTNFLRNMSTKTGGRNTIVRFFAPGQNGFTSGFWLADPANRQRLDHYVGPYYRPGPDDDPEGWDSDGWEDEYAGPLRQEAQQKLDAQFGRDMLNVEIGEKGSIDVQATDKGMAALGLAPAKRAAVLWKRGCAEGQPGAINTARAQMQQLLAVLRAMAWNYQTSHWQVAGDSFYGDHLLFERLYGSAQGEVDGLAEKMMGLFGKDAVEGPAQAWQMAQVLQKMAEIGCPYQRGLQAEQKFQVLLKQAMETLEDLGQLTLGLSDFLPAMASTHDSHIYLLQQRLGGVKVAAAFGQHDIRRALQARYMLKRVLAGKPTRSLPVVEPKLFRAVHPQRDDHTPREFAFADSKTGLKFRAYESLDGDAWDFQKNPFRYRLYVKDPEGQVWRYPEPLPSLFQAESVATDTIIWWQKGEPRPMSDVFPRRTYVLERQRRFAQVQDAVEAHGADVVAALQKAARAS